MAADVIYVVDQGKIVESGTHDELLSNEGLYAHLYREQYDSGRIEARFQDGVVFSDGRIIPHDPQEPALASTSGSP
jgi:ATP-binding cassette subfamily B protein